MQVLIPDFVLMIVLRVIVGLLLVTMFTPSFLTQGAVGDPLPAFRLLVKYAVPASQITAHVNVCAVRSSFVLS